MEPIESLVSLTLDLPPSCVVFSPTHPDLFVVGTYFLHREEHNDGTNIVEQAVQKRSGTLVLFRLIDNKLVQLQTLEADFAILDIQFSPHDPSSLCVATSTGSLAFYDLDSSEPRLTQQSIHQIFDESILVLDLEHHPKSVSTIGITTSTGKVYIYTHPNADHVHGSAAAPTTVQTATHLQHINTHDLEAWTLSFSPSGERLYSGGDDATLRSSTTTTPTPASDDVPPDFAQWSDRRIHGAGVTAILPLSNTVLVTGSYDDRLRVLHAPEVGRKTVLAELDLGGGVWRLCCLESDELAGRWVVLASCMHAGARVVQLRRQGDGGGGGVGADAEWEIEVLGKFEEHESMNYGSDAQPGSNKRKRIISSSFYDKLLCLWEFELP